MIRSPARPYASAPSLSKTQTKYLKRQLKKHGWESYREYITSKAWWRKKEQYRATNLAQECLVCGDPNVDLHHRSYKRVCGEKLTDLFPLCLEHHEAAHRRDRELAALGVEHQGLWNIVRLLRNEFEAELEQRRAARLEVLGR